MVLVKLLSSVAPQYTSANLNHTCDTQRNKIFKTTLRNHNKINGFFLIYIYDCKNNQIKSFQSITCHQSHLNSTRLRQCCAHLCFSVKQRVQNTLARIVTPVPPNPSQPPTGSQLNGESTSRPPSLTNFFRPDNRPTWPVQSLHMPPGSSLRS